MLANVMQMWGAIIELYFMKLPQFTSLFLSEDSSSTQVLDLILLCLLQEFTSAIILSPSYRFTCFPLWINLINTTNIL
jgi:hypothetical protein